MDDNMVSFICECDDMNCPLRMALSLAEAANIHKSGCFFIVDGCTTPRSRSDVVIHRMTGYMLVSEDSLTH